MLVFPQFDPIALRLGPLAIHWYGIAYLLAFGCAWALGRRQLQQARRPISISQFDDLLFYAMLGVIIGGRLGYMLFYATSTLLAKPWQLFAIWQGGMSFHGGLLGVSLAVVLWARAQQVALLAVGDFLVPLVPIGLGLGRLANFINGELVGRPTTVAWGMVFPHIDQLVRHPSQLYEFLLEGIGLGILMACYRRCSTPQGATSAVFLLAYALVRFVVECWRAPDPQLGLLWLGLSMGQWLSLPTAVVGAILYWHAIRNASTMSGFGKS